MRTNALMTEAVHRNGGLAGCEFAHSGLYSRNVVTRIPAMGPSRARGERGCYQRSAARSITPCSTGAPAPSSPAGSLRVASSVTSNPGSPRTAEVSRQPMR